MYKFSRASAYKLSGIDEGLAAVVRRALSYNEIDITVIAGMRSIQEQRDLYARGRTAPGPKVTWTMSSKHLIGEAVDVVPYPIVWQDTPRFKQLALLMYKAADELDVSVTWGGNWATPDYPHWQLK